MSAWTFLRSFLRDPSRIGSVTPSSRALSRRVVSAVHPRDGDVILELGAGTGPITAAVLEARPHGPFLALEPTDELAAVLAERFPDVDVLRAYADRDLRALIQSRGHDRCDCVVSGLPWSVWPDALQDDVLAGVCDAMADDGRFATYTYVTSSMVPGQRAFIERMRRAFHDVHHTEVVWRNVPPAWVYVGERPRRDAGA